MLTHVGNFPSPVSAAALAIPALSEADYVSPYLRRPLRPLDEVERARKTREGRRAPAERAREDRSGQQDRRDQ